MENHRHVRQFLLNTSSKVTTPLKCGKKIFVNPDRQTFVYSFDNSCHEGYRHHNAYHKANHATPCLTNVWLAEGSVIVWNVKIWNYLQAFMYRQCKIKRHLWQRIENFQQLANNPLKPRNHSAAINRLRPQDTLIHRLSKIQCIYTCYQGLSNENVMGNLEYGNECLVICRVGSLLESWQQLDDHSAYAHLQLAWLPMVKRIALIRWDTKRHRR